MLEKKKIFLGFLSIVVVVICLGGHSQWQLAKISQDADNLYRHPFTVSNAAKSINFHLVCMHRHMKDIVLALSEEELNSAVDEVAIHEQAVLKGFDIIFERFLGDKSQLNKTYAAFIDWRPIRNEVIELAKLGRNTKAIAITNGKGAQHVASLNILVEDLVSFAAGKAEEFHSRSQENASNAMIINLVFTVIALSLVIIFALHIKRSLAQAKKDRSYRSHLIDQNIMLATLDKNAVVKDASSALCRFLGTRKQDLIGKDSHFFDNSDESPQLAEDILASIQTGKEWTGEIKHYDHSGNTKWASSTILPNYDEDYQVSEFTNILVSITNKKLSGVDKLTSMLNRRRFDESIVHEMRVAKRNGYNFTLAVLDIDFFKKYNDHYGHPQGDSALQQVSNKIMTYINRPTDFAFRVGGEEFAIIFANLSKVESQAYLEKIRKGVESLHIAHKKNDISPYLTVSIGACVIDSESNLDEQQVYIEADKALYMAKESRNKVCVG